MQQVDVKVDDDEHIVHLKGVVGSMAERSRAEEVADAVVGTTGRVLNELTVKGLNDTTAGDLDGDIQENLDKMIDNDPTLKQRDINFEVVNGMVTIKGDGAQRRREESCRRYDEGGAGREGRRERLADRIRSVIGCDRGQKRRDHRFMRPRPVTSAASAGLHYVTDDRPGIRREMGALGFRYTRADGRPVRSPADLRRIRALAIPPAWKDVWICADPKGHVQATGRDARGRKQYRYHSEWRANRDGNKFDRLEAFASVLPVIRAGTAADMARPGLPREKVLATVVQLLEKSLIRVGNDEYAKANRSFGLTTLRDQHVDVKGSTLRFEFRGKSGKRHSVDISDRRLARIVKQCRDLPGQELFQYLDDDGQRQNVNSADVNEYLREITGTDFTAKDFRTWSGTVLAVTALRECRRADSMAAAKKNVVRADRRGRWRAREYAGGLPKVVHPSGHSRVLSGSVDGGEAGAVAAGVCQEGGVKAPVGRSRRAAHSSLHAVERIAARRRRRTPCGTRFSASA